MIPAFNHSGVIPPFLTAPTQRASPYETTPLELVDALGTTPERRALIEGLLDYRAALIGVGITSGFQLIDGSFTEDCETLRGRPPGDIDLVTFAFLPAAPAAVQAFVAANQHVFVPALAKAAYNCDAYFIDLGKPSQLIVDDTFYWHGLFSHQKNTLTWKGMLRIPLMADDVAARARLALAAGATNGP